MFMTDHVHNRGRIKGCDKRSRCPWSPFCNEMQWYGPCNENQ